MGRIVELNIRNDGEIRSAKVKLPSRRVVNRPINLLYRLEIPSIQAPEVQSNRQQVSNVQTKINDKGMTKNVPYINHRPSHQAADQCRSRLQEMITT